MAVHKWEKRPTANFGEVWTPVANVHLRSLNGQFHSFAFQIDSGAVISLLKRSVADILGIDLVSGRRVQLTSVGGGGSSAYVHPITARFDTGIEYVVPFAIAESETVPNLLGRAGVFDVLQIDFDVTLHETRITAPWLTPNDRRIWEFLIDTEKHILARLAEAGFASPVPIVIGRFLNRAEMLFVSAAGLQKLHRLYAAPLFIRAMFEVCIQFQYLMQDPGPRAQDYLDFSIVTRYKQVKAVLKDPQGLISRHIAESPMRAENEPELERDYQQKKTHFEYQDKWGKARLFDSWYKMKIDQLAELVGAGGEYRLWYKSSAAWAHGDPFSTQFDGRLQNAVNKHSFLYCARYYARMLFCVAESAKMLLTSEQFNVLKQMTEDMS